jgi:aminoglycoside phosphotransferase (APT) family kinase protein
MIASRGEEQRAVKEDIVRFVLEKGWLSRVDSVSFLAAGEYNENYLIEAADGRYVFRINRGSQLGLDRQIAYEFQVLKNLESSGVTPRPFYCEAEPGSPGKGVLLMEFIPGAPLDYRRDLDKAAEIFARVHALGTGEGLIVQGDPVRDIAAESHGLLNRYPDHPMREKKDRLLSYHREVLDLANRTGGLFAEENLCIVNTEVNSNNFIVDGERASLVDWEKAVVSYRYQDLGHFLVPTTTLWKSDYTFDGESRERFLRSYHRVSGIVDRGFHIDFDDLSLRTSILEKTILLRALSWCFMAYYEYTMQPRELKNEDTFRRMESYLQDMECFLS